MVSKLVIGAGALAFVGVGAAGLMLSKSTAPDTGAGTKSTLPNATSIPKNDQMTPVTANEADRRATVNQEDAARAQKGLKDYQAPTVITQVGPADKPEVPNLPDPKPAGPPVERIIKEKTERTVYVTRQQVDQPVDDSAARQSIQAQINSLANPRSGSNAPMMVVARYAPPPEPPKPAPTANSSGNGNGGGSVQQRPPALRMIARTGDVIFARLDRGFNSDDPSAPIIVTLDDVIYDPARGSRPGPLTGMRMVGQIQYSSGQSAISFSQLVTVDGHQFPTRAIAIAEDTARTGVATNVDNHTLSRYGGLLVSSLLQGVGQVGNQLVQNNRSFAVSDGVVTSAANRVNYGQAAVAALQPLGQNLAQVAAQNFSRPPTMTAPAGTGIGVVFLQPVTIPKGIR